MLQESLKIEVCFEIFKESSKVRMVTDIWNTGGKKKKKSQQKPYAYKRINTHKKISKKTNVFNPHDCEGEVLIFHLLKITLSISSL